ncbi:MAG TPA: stage III sporulation AC/AD family protein [Firmicutes bacterium]|nr:stage III sporulation AC/AD family protein [Bacillota bacterium]
MEIAAIIGVALIAMILCVLLRGYRPEYSVFLSLTAGIFILLMALNALTPMMGTLSQLIEISGQGREAFSILLKALGVCFITQLASDACKDAGEGAIASKVELAGKVVILLLAMPLFEQIIGVATSLMTV